jgi:hypothetical protein
MTGNVSDYTGRITSEHRNKPKFLASVIASVQPLVDVQYACNNMYAYYDLDNAVGAQLDTVGLWLGIKRALSVPLPAVFFSWDTLGLGWDQGLWLGAFQPTTGLSILSDDDYRAVLKMRAALNKWDGSTADLDALVSQTFESLFPGLTMNLIDNYNMSITFQLYGNKVFGKYSAAGLTPIVQQLFLQGLLTVRPCTVAAIYKLWNGSAFVTSAFQYGITLTSPAAIATALPITSIAISGMIMPQTSAQNLRLQVGTSNALPPASLGLTAGSGQPPPSAGANWYTPTTYDNTAGAFSISLPADITVAGTYYVWAYDPASGLLQCSNPIIVT